LAYERLVRKITKENLWLYVINVLKDTPLYGYAVKKAIRDKFKFSPSTVTVYAVLYRMVHEGLIEKEVRDDTTYYRPTEKGMEVFRRAKDFFESLYRSLFEGL